MIDLARAPTELFLRALESNLRQLGPVHKLQAHLLDAVRLRLEADCAGLVFGPYGGGGGLTRGAEALWDRELAGAFLRREAPLLPATTVLTPLVRGRRQLGVLGAVRRERPFGRSARRTLERLADVLAVELSRREEERQTRVLNRIREKIVSELRPRDLAYQILDGLHQLADYDHSSAFLTYDPGASVLRIEAEKIVWTKAKSAWVGRELAVSPAEVEALRQGPAVRSLEGADGASGDPVAGVFRRLLEHHRGGAVPAVSSLLTAPLFFGEAFLGLLEIAAWRRPPFDADDLAVVERFLPAAAVSIRNARVNLSLERQAVEAEVKASLVTLARAVAHDVNNAVGSILPLAQQMQEDLRQGELRPEVLGRDLATIVDNARLCQRIFTNMLRAGGGGPAPDGPVDLGQAVREALAFLQGRAERRGVDLVLDLPADLPAVRCCSRQDLQHVVLNLVTNALDALEHGGQVTLTARHAAHDEGDEGDEGKEGDEGDGGDEEVVLTVADDGPGIAPELLGKVQEPFFTTKTGGTGLGLAICRSLAWKNGGTFEIDSPPGAGVRATLRLPISGRAGRAA
jgi:two-component system, NtrC family, sensor kinase